MFVIVLCVCVTCLIFNTHAISYNLHRPTVRAQAKDAKIQEGFKSVGSYDTRKFLELIENQCPSYKMITARLRGEMRLIILVRDELESEVENVYVAGENTGIGGVMANKVCICMLFFLCETFGWGFVFILMHVLIYHCYPHFNDIKLREG